MPHDRILALQREIAVRKSCGLPVAYLEQLVDRELDAEVHGEGFEWCGWALAAVSAAVVVVCMLGAAYA